MEGSRDFYLTAKKNVFAINRRLISQISLVDPNMQDMSVVFLKKRCNFLPRMIFSRFCSKDLPAPQKTFLVLALLPLLVFDIAFQTLFAPINLSDLSAAAYFFGFCFCRGIYYIYLLEPKKCRALVCW